MKITVEDVQKYIELVGGIDLLTDAQRAALPQEFINQYAAKGGRLSGFSEAQIAKIPQEIINQNVANGGKTLYSLTYEQIEAIPQDAINQRVAKGGNLFRLTYEQIAAIPQEFVNQRAAKGGDLDGLTDAQKAAIPQEIINQYVAKGGDLDGLTDAQKAAIPQEIINQYVANGGGLYRLTDAQIAAIPQEFVNQRAAKGGDLRHLTKTQIAAIPYQIRYVTEEATEAIILYAAGKITLSELPADVYANGDARENLLDIILQKTVNELEKMCESAGYITDDVPEEVIQVFDERFAGIEKEVKAKMFEVVKQLTYPGEQRQKEKTQKGQELENVVVEKTKQDLWGLFESGKLRFETAKKLLGDDPDFADKAFEIEKDKIMAEFRALKQKGKVTRAVADEYKQRLQDVIDMIYNSNSGNADDGPKFGE